MTEADLAIVAALVFFWGSLSARLERFDFTAPIIFVIAGLLLTHGPLAVLSSTPDLKVVRDLAELTLVLVLFSDASRVRWRDIEHDRGLYLRLLGAGLPLTIVLGTLLAVALFAHIDIWLALLIGAALAPTDAALGAGLIVNPAVPARVRRLINVESGLNDGIVTPVVLVAIAGAKAAGHGPGVAGAIRELLLGVVLGACIGAAGGAVVGFAQRRGWPAVGLSGVAILGLALCSYATSVALDGNGFIAAFVGGLAYAAVTGRRGVSPIAYVEETGALVSLLVWLSFGAIAVVPAFDNLTWQICLYAVLALTVVRMLPVAIALAGARLGRTTVAFIGWFGPRGLASIVFALLAGEELGKRVAGPAVAVIAVTVLLSVVAHGVTATPLARRCQAALARDAAAAASPETETPAVAPEMPTRRLIRAPAHHDSGA
jgi:sodium/hydrogen antiporter